MGCDKTISHELFMDASCNAFFFLKIPGLARSSIGQPRSDRFSFSSHDASPRPGVRSFCPRLGGQISPRGGLSAFLGSDETRQTKLCPSSLGLLRAASCCQMAVVVKTNGVPFWGIGAPPILGFILVGIGMFTGGTGY